MRKYLLRYHLNGSVIEIYVMAPNASIARAMGDAQYGKQNFSNGPYEVK
jgi:hypothetical protein